MTDLKVQHILTLTQLIAQGARHNFVPITTSYLGKSINKSQQSASKHLRELEKDGFIERIMHGRKFSVKITSKGYTKQFKSKINYIPFPGTLNVKLHEKEYIEAAQQFRTLNGVIIKGFCDSKRTYGWVKCFKCKLNNSIDCELIILERTHHDESIIELISKTNIRKTAKLRDSSKLTIRIPIMG